MKKTYFTLLALCLLSSIGYAQQKGDTLIHIQPIAMLQEIEEELVSYDFVPIETPPSFMGSSDYAEFKKWIINRIAYPVVASENGIQGRVIIKFTIDTDGNITDVKVIRGVDPSLDKEALRVIKSSPKWLPARQNGLTVRYPISVSIDFRLQN